MFNDNLTGQNSSGGFYCLSSGVGVSIITAHFNTNATAAMNVAEFSGLPALNALDQHSALNTQLGGTLTNFTSNSVTTTAGNELLIGWAGQSATGNTRCSSGGGSVGAGWTGATDAPETLNGFDNCFAYQIVSVSNAYAFTGTWSANIGPGSASWAYIVTFFGASSPSIGKGTKLRKLTDDF